MSLKVTGHADFSENGKDIVCASISTVLCSLAKYVDMQLCPHEIDMEYGDVYIEMHYPDDRSREVFNFCVETLRDIANLYPGYVRVGLPE